MIRIVVDDGRPTLDNMGKWADLYIVGPYWPSRPATYNPKGRVLVSVQATVHFSPVGDVVSDPFNEAVAAAAYHLGALLPGVLGIEPNGYWTRGIDLTKRGVVQALIPLWLNTFKDFDGFRWDVCTPLSDPTDPWDSSMTGLANAIRESGKLLICQQFHNTPPVMASNGAYWEQSPTSFHYTMDRHTQDLQGFKDALKVAKDPREVIFVAEVRDPSLYPKWYLDQVKAWVDANNLYLSVGEGAAAGEIL